MDYYISGAALRLFQTVIYASLWIVIGCFIAAIFRRILGAEKVKQIFGDQTGYGLLVGWLIGMLLPVCSLGVIPIVREMHRAGVKRGTIVAFGLTAPLFNPMSVLYGLTLSDPIAIIMFSFCALLIVSGVGFVWNRISKDTEDVTIKYKEPAYGIKRSVSIFYSAGRELVGPSMVYILLGILASVTLAVLLPKGYLQNQVNHDDILAPFKVLLVATPIYSTPLLAMSQIGGMFQHGNSIGAAFSLLILGAGANIGLLAWIARTYGFQRLLVFFALLAGTTVGLAYAIDKPLYPKGVDPEGHTHAFDVYTHPFGDLPAKQLYTNVSTRAKDFYEKNEFGGTWLLAGLLFTGLISTVVARFADVEVWFASTTKTKDSFDRVIPGSVLGIVVVLGLVVASVLGCYIFYPSAEEAFAELQAPNTNAILYSRGGDWDAADKSIRYADDLSRRLEIGVFLREGSVGEFQSAKAKAYRERLEELKDAIDQRDKKLIKEVSDQTYKAYRQLRAAFIEDEGLPASE